MSFQIESDRLLIRDIEEKDISTLLSHFSEPISKESILSYQSNKNYNLEQLKKSILEAKQPHRRRYDLAVTLKIDNTLIGNCIIGEVYPESIEAFLGWHFGSKFWGNGYATEAAKQLLFIGFALNKVKSIYADCFANNKASVRIMEKIGMTPSLNIDFFNKMRGLSYGEKKSTVRYDISREQWLKNKTENNRS